MGRILISIEDIPKSAPVVRFAGMVAQSLALKVTLMTVIRRKSRSSEAEKRLEKGRQMLEELDAELDVETRVRLGEGTGKAILADLGRGNYELAAVGVKTAGALMNLPFSSVEQYVVGRARRPVLVVRGGTVGLHRILICTGGQEISESVVCWGVRLANGAQAGATVLHVAQAVPSMYTGMGEMEESLAELLQTTTPLASHLKWCARYLERNQVMGVLELRHGVVVDEIIREAHRGAYDLIVVGSHGSASVWEDLMLNNVTRRVVNCAPCPVLVV